MDTERESLRGIFDSAARRYHAARPDYPAELLDALIEMTGLIRGDRLLEIGCGTGKATIPLAARGFHITCVELGTELARVAAHNLAAYPNVVVEVADFDTWQLGGRGPFDLVYAATAWHWLDPSTRYQRAHAVLRPAGHLAFWSALHVVPDGGDPIFQELQEVYESIGEGFPPGETVPRPGELPDSGAEIAASGLFELVAIRHFDWETRYDAEAYINLLETFSGHLAMEQWKRDRLYGEIRRRLAARPDGLLRRHWGAVLHVARRSG